MPESRRRKPKAKGRPGRLRLAALDGTLIRIRACCRVDVTIGVPACTAAHDQHCTVPHDQTDAGKLRRIDVLLILRDKLATLHGIRTTVLMDGTTGAAALIVHSEQSKENK